MSKLKKYSNPDHVFADPKKEYDACADAEKLILAKIAELSVVPGDKYTHDINKLAVGLTEIQSIKDRAQTQYNAKIERMADALDRAERADTCLEKLNGLCALIREVVQLDPIKEEGSC